MVNPVEMASKEKHELKLLNGIPAYREHFEAAFPGVDELVTFGDAERALAAFQETLITPNALFDRFLRGEDGAMTDRQKAGSSSSSTPDAPPVTTASISAATATSLSAWSRSPNGPCCRPRTAAASR
jgi:hypothetical protein